MADKSLTAINSRNFNPGNIRPSSAYTWNGEVGANGGFSVFKTPEHGTRALVKNLYTSQEKHGNNSVREIISRWAPPSENNTTAYVNKVASDMGVDPDADLGSLKNQPEVTKALTKSIIEHEGGGMGVYSDEVIDNGVAMANGKPDSEINFTDKPSDFEADKITEDKDKDADANDGFFVEKDEPPVTSPNLVKKDIVNTTSSNWMSEVDSPQYLWTLFIVNNEVWNNPRELEGSNSAAVNSGKAMIIAQQGVTTQFSLDNFAMIATVTPGQAHGNTTPGIIQFDLFENLGFTFLDRLLKAGLSLGKPGNLHEQNYVLRLEFVGRDTVSGGSIKYPGTFFYPIKMNQIRSTTGPEGTRYNCIGWSIIKHGQTESVTDTDITVKNITQVMDFTDGFVKKFNKEQENALSEVDLKSGKVPPKTISIEFDKSTDIKGIKGLQNFNLKVKPWAGTANQAEASAQSSDTEDPSKRAVTINAETGISEQIGQLLQKNVPAFADYVKEAQKIGMTPSIVVDTIPKYPDNFAGTGTSADAYVQPIHVTHIIKINQNWTTQNQNPGDHRKKFADNKFQSEKFKMLPIEKNYTYLYTGLNTEVLNYQIDIESLYTVVTVPQAGLYHADASQKFTPTTPSKVTKFLEDVPYDKVPTNFNDYTKFISKPLGINEQRKNETDGSQTLISNMASNMAKREYDAYQFTMEIKGDPYWMSGSLHSTAIGTNTPDYSSRDALVSFLQYNPNAEDLIENQTRGPVDLVSSGIYKVTKIESRFQGGKFTQTLSGYKDPTTNTLLILPQLIEISGV